uniref:RAB4A, member RAS onco family n=1 Tax=Felis catus TaxID=9685 RepID=A0ABI7Y585_FELCA
TEGRWRSPPPKPEWTWRVGAKTSCLVNVKCDVFIRQSQGGVGAAAGSSRSSPSRRFLSGQGVTRRENPGLSPSSEELWDKQSRLARESVTPSWRRSGQSVTRSYYRGAAGALLVYDITSRETYNALTNWLTDARMLASQNIVIILCGNKKDLDADREVTFLEASRFAQENELMFLETSALTGENVEEAFVQCARKILNKIESGELDPERMGSGIQYGDAALRQLRSPRRAQAPSAQECGC